ncbi:Hypothetical predicted protein [Pelobates cultripes]|uniref:Aftiphilin clathrin-binding box domain-containing protein n=1 Tax=Pelobates cultripes TaxID=61616 RepID=A0AAD1WMA6_PELCU|nr:Hypothetical predicted protein [Pelobates cultripes]
MLQESLGWVFEDCFPSYSPPVIEDDIKPLEPPQPASGDLTTSPSHSQSATCLWGAVCDRRTHPNRQCKWEGSKLHNSYLSSLHIDPNDKLPAHKNKFPVTSPALREKQPPHKLSMGKEAELKLMKVASVSVHVSGFSPSHHLQSLFQHWTQPQGKPRLKVAYEFKHSLMA